MYSDSNESVPIRALTLLSAITSGHATIEDIAIELRKQSFDYSPFILRQKTPPEFVSRIVQRVPEVPFIFNGTIYDPKDITRFNGQELNFVPAPAGNHMLVVDNQALFENWFQLAYLEQYGYGSYQRIAGLPGIDLFPRDKTLFWEDINNGGEFLDVTRGYGYKDLTKVGMGYFFGDWNDKISSVQMRGSRLVTLYEHINWTGQTLTLYTSNFNLHRYGWGDRTSSFKTW